MTSNAFHLKIISPASVVMDTHVRMTEIPGTEGDFGVLPGHAAVLSMLRPGVITVHLADGAQQRFFAATGYADVSAEGCTILSDHVQDLATISVEEAREALAAAQTAASAAQTEAEIAKAARLLAAAEVLVAAVSSTAVH